MLWSRDLNTELPIASITKVMTALVVIRAGDLGRKITVPSAVVGYVAEHDASNAGLRPGDTLTAAQLLEGLLLPSGADAAYTLAEAYGPGLRAFIAKMNATAKLLGMTRTHFTNFDGLPWPTGYSTYSTPANLITLGRVAMSSAVFRSITDRRSYRIAAGRGHHAYYWQNLNPLLGVYRGAIRDQDRIHPGRGALPAVRGHAWWPVVHRGEPRQPRHRHHGQRSGCDPHAELGLQPPRLLKQATPVPRKCLTAAGMTEIIVVACALVEP